MNILRNLCKLAITLIIAARCSAAVTIYVSPGGNDQWTGEQSEPKGGVPTGPKATLAGALHQAREIRSIRPNLSTPIKIVLRGGTYELANTLVLTPADSGTERSPLVIEAQPNETPIISGGTNLQTGSRNGDLWIYKAPVVSGGTQFSQLYVNGVRRQRVRMPKRGYYYIANSKDLTKPYTSDQFEFYPGNINSDANPKELVIRAFHAWNVYTLQVASVDNARRLVVFNTPMPGRGRLPLDRKIWYTVENDQGAPLAPGEWHLNSGSGEISYSPLPDERFLETKVTAPRLERLLVLQGNFMRLQGTRIYGKEIQNVQFRNLTFAYTDWTLPAKGLLPEQGAILTPGAVEVAGAHNISFYGCQFRETGACGLLIGAHVHHFTIQDSLFGDLGSNAIRIGSFDTRDLVYPAQWTSDGKVQNNYVKGFGQVHPDACGIMSGFAGGIEISNNTISDGYYTGISVGWNFAYGIYAAKDNIIRQNRISTIGQSVLSDMGGIYTLGEQPGTQIVGNLISDVQCARYGAWGIYLDEGSASISVTNNLAYNLGSAAIHLHWGRDIDIESNILALGKDCIFENTRGAQTGHYIFRSNILLTDRSPFFGRYGILDGTEIGNNDYIVMKGATVAGAFPGKVEMASWKTREPTAASDDPMFTDPRQGDFSAKDRGPLRMRGVDVQAFNSTGATIGATGLQNKIWWDPAPAPQ